MRGRRRGGTEGGGGGELNVNPETYYERPTTSGRYAACLPV